MITQLRKFPEFGKYFARGFQAAEDAINNLAKNLGVNPTGIAQTPPPIGGLNVKQSNDGFFHVAINDNSAISRNLRYFVEYSTDPAFPGNLTHAIDMGASRTHPPFKLPALNDAAQAQTFYFRAFSQYPGSKPGKKVNFGGTAPTGITPAGTTQMTLLSSTGSGTTSALTPHSGEGLGTFLERPEQGPKRSPMAEVA